MIKKYENNSRNSYMILIIYAYSILLMKKNHLIEKDKLQSWDQLSPLFSNEEKEGIFSI
jgi:hypothetical protein